MRAFITLACTAALLLGPIGSAQASPACSGCNLVDEGSLTPALVGQTAYYGQTPYTVTGVDASRQVVYLRDSAGEAKWGDARELYSRQARGERDGNWALAAAAGGAVVWCLLGGCSNKSSSGSGSDERYGSAPERATTTYYRQTETVEAPRSAPVDTSIGCAWGDRAYGTCH